LKNRYSKYIRQLLLLIDLTIINVVLFFVLEKWHQNIFMHFYLSSFWMVSSLLLGYYKIRRYTGVYKVLSLIIKQANIFTLGFFAYFGIFKEGLIVNKQFNTLLITLLSLAFIRILFFTLIKNYRRLGKNYRKVVFLERDVSAKRIMNLFKKRKYLGYKVDGFFSKSFCDDPFFLGLESSIYTYVIENNIDEIYATLSHLKKEQVKNLTKFSNQNNIQLKLIPNPNELYSRSHEVEVFEDAFKILSVKKMPFQLAENRMVKRIFDIVFSFFVILFLMSWLTPILWILIK